jgi:hypothetical protein
MTFVVMGCAQRHRELIAHFDGKASWLGKRQMMSMARYASAYEAGVISDELQMSLVAQAPFSAEPLGPPFPASFL